MWRKIKEFSFGAGGWAVASELASLVFFALSIISASRYGPLLSSFVLMAISVPLFWVGAFIAWNNKTTELEVEKAKNAKPDIVGRVLLAINRMVGESTENGVTTPNCTIAMKLSVTSRTNVDTTLKDAELHLTHGGHEYLGQRLPLGRWDVYQSTHGGAHSERMNDLISSITYGSPIRYRVASEGWLDFLVEGMDIRLNQGPERADIKVTLVDEVGDRHVITAESVVIRS